MAFRLFALTLLFLPLDSSHAPRVFDLSQDFSLEQRPGSVWQYGYSAGNSLDGDQFRLDTSVDRTLPISFWHPLTKERGQQGYYPYVAWNSAATTQREPTHGWAARAGQVAMEASNDGQYSLIRFVAPAAGVYRIGVRWEGIHFRLSTTDVHVLVDGSVHLFDASIDGYGGDPAFHPREGAHPTASYNGQVRLKAGHSITFAVGYGDNKTNYNDTTGLFARIVLVPGAHTR